VNRNEGYSIIYFKEKKNSLLLWRNWWLINITIIDNNDDELLNKLILEINENINIDFRGDKNEQIKVVHFTYFNNCFT
jgi:hypothetical protein